MAIKSFPIVYTSQTIKKFVCALPFMLLLITYHNNTNHKIWLLNGPPTILRNNTIGHQYIQFLRDCHRKSQISTTTKTPATVEKGHLTLVRTHYFLKPNSSMSLHLLYFIVNNLHWVLQGSISVDLGSGVDAGAMQW